ncbi:MAG TPA: hypothetical protein VN641_10315 [Urbifossiella sp.]|nr:hypothetical protein [Urbifossiella sp.]
MTRVTAPSRLHFGLLHVPFGDVSRSGRSFGGVGLMIDRPGVVVSARPAAAWQFEGMLASRAQEFAHRFLAGRTESPPLQVLVERCPEQHTGLGVGTQLGLAVGLAIAAELGQPGIAAVELAERVGRGQRSAIGVHGFDRGGLIVEMGKLPGEPVAPLFRALTLPEAWRVAVFVPQGEAAWHGGREEQAFAAAGTGSPSDSLTATLTDIMLQRIVPAAEAGHLTDFGEAVYEFNRRAGEPFAAAQGGPYSSAAIAEIIDCLRKLGVAGVGQSSWGPAVFAIVESADRAASLMRQLQGAARGWTGRISPGRTVETA